MAFVQIIEMEIDASRYQDVQALEEEWRARTEGERTVVRDTLCRDRSNPNRYVSIVEFPSHAEAVRNSELPATQEFALRLEEVTRSVRYLDLEVQEVRED